MFIKLSEATFVDVENTDSVINDPKFNTETNSKVLSKFAEFTKNLKRIAPKANDFLYFSAIMMHAAEAAALDDEGNLKVLSNGNPVEVGWEKSGSSLKWKSNDPSLKPYRNSNRDIFPEEELLKAYKKWVGKPLCIDHQSSSVDHVRGFIVDTYYDNKLKRVIALCALDKKNYPDLAHKVSSGYSNNVSMGTAVGQAICSDCGKAAKIESEFCNHMRSKSCYGEINIDLSPIELSIVVNGADPKAKIKHIIAAANNLNSYINKKEAELAKLAENFVFSGNFSMSTGDDDHAAAAEFKVDNKSSFEEFKSSVETALRDLEAKYKKIKESEEELSEEKNYAEDGNYLTYTTSMEEGQPNDATIKGMIPAPKFASSDPIIEELKSVTASIEQKLQHLKKLSTKLQEENMSGNRRFNKEAYFQGAGGANEPTPGKVKYAPDPLNEKDRLEEDKQMLVDDLGATDELFPGDLDRKKMLARAAAEERALRRQAAVTLAKEALERKAYFQGGGGVNEPTPGKVKYAPDPLNEKLRDQDKQMVGQKPFPEVGSVDGLHPSPESVKEKDELKRKEMLRRAGLKAQFVKAAELGESRWNVFAGDKLILSASVDEISGNRSDLMYDSIATKDFGSKLIEKVKTAGIDRVKSLFKAGQAAPAAAPAAPVAPGGDMGMGAPEMGAPAMGEETSAPAEAPSKEGDPSQVAMDLAQKMLDMSSDLVEALRALTGEKAEMGALENIGKPGGMAGVEGLAAGEETSAPVPAKAASAEIRTLANMRKELNGALISSMKEAVAELKDHREELEMIANMYHSGSVNNQNARYVGSLVTEAFSDAKKSIADVQKLMGAFVKYAHGTEAMIKRANAENQLLKLAQDINDVDYSDMSLEELIADQEKDRKETKTLGREFGRDLELGEGESEFEDEEDLEEDEDLTEVGEDEGPTMLRRPGKALEEMDLPEVGEDDEPIFDEGKADDDNDADYVVDANNAGEVAKKMKGGDTLQVNAGFNLSSKQGRSAYRAKLAAEAMEVSPMLDEAHPKGGFTTQLDVKPEGELAHVEDLKELHDAMMDVATASPKVRKEAATIHRLVSEGKLDAADVDSLVAEGVDAETVKYYKEFYGQVEGGKEFASELVKEAAEAKLAEEKEVYRVKLARAYELAYDMVARGLCSEDRDAVTAQVEEIMKFNDESFDSLKRVVAKHQPLMQKQASAQIPNVGLIGNGDIVAQAQHEDLYSQLTAAFSNSNKRAF